MKKRAALEIVPESHLDHGLSEQQIEHIKEQFSDCEQFVLKTIEIPGSVPCGLYGPEMGDAPITDDEAYYEVRGDREWESRLIDKPMRSSNKVTVIAGPHGDKPCVLYTAYGGPAAPQEPGDPNARDKGASESFWSAHALASGKTQEKQEDELKEEESVEAKVISALSKLAKSLYKMGLHKDAGEMVNLLNDLIDMNVEDEEQEPCDKAISGNGLREDGSAENLNQGFSVEPRYFM